LNFSSMRSFPALDRLTDRLPRANFVALAFRSENWFALRAPRSMG
jgi:hypothetical protein